MSGRWRSLQAIRCRPSRLNCRVTAFGHNVRMSKEYPLTLYQADKARSDFATIESDLQFLMGQLARIPTRKGTGPQRAWHHLRDNYADDTRGFVVHRLLALLPMTRAGPIVAAVIAALLSSPLSAREYRSREVTREFQREHPCPSTGKTSGGCPGYRKDHVIPLACGGSDAVSNMQWQTVAAARAKDRWELRACGR
jgi:hypothetical protein